MMLSPGCLLDIAAAALGPELLAGVQLHEAGQLLGRVAWPAGMPQPGEHAVRSWRETQGIGAYAPPVAPFPLLPTAPALIYAAGAMDLVGLAGLLAARYPPGHAVVLLLLDGEGAVGARHELNMGALTSALALRAAACVLYVAPLPIALDRRGLDGLHWAVARLLGPGGCPWDVRQTHGSLRAALLEEAHEALEALDLGDMAGLSEELGDLLISVLAHSEMARQGGAFAIGDVLSQVTGKLIGRHPHVFGDLAVSGEGEVLGNWERIKAGELAAKGRARASAIDGVPAGLPALAAAQKVGKKAARAGFNWDDLGGVWAKVDEELAELRAAPDAAAAAEELGDLLFVLTRLADWLGLDAETALREAIQKFRRRFVALERIAAGRGLALAELELDALLGLWGEARREA